MVRARERKGRVRARVLAVDGFAFVGSRTAELLLLRAAPASVERESNIIVIIVLPPGSSICPRPCTHGSSSFLVQRFGVRLVRCFFCILLALPIVFFCVHHRRHLLEDYLRNAALPLPALLGRH